MVPGCLHLVTFNGSISSDQVINKDEGVNDGTDLHPLLLLLLMDPSLLMSMLLLDEIGEQRMGKEQKNKHSL